MEMAPHTLHICINHSLVYLYDNLNVIIKCIWGFFGGGGAVGGVLMQALNMQCASDLTEYGRGGM